MHILSLTSLIISLTVVSLSSVQAQPCSGTCLHQGTFNTTTCKCICTSSAYNGKFCQYANCSQSAQNSDCNSTASTTQLCNIKAFKVFCPLACNASVCHRRRNDICNIDSCLNGGTFNATSWYLIFNKLIYI